MNNMEENKNSDPNTQENADNFFALSVPKSEESFPVLKAFQDFLDAERERARRRQMTLAISFMVALVVLVVLFCGIGVVIFSGMVTRSDSKQDKLLEMLLSQRAAAQQASVTVAPAPRAEPDPVINEMMTVLKQLRAETAELKAAASEVAKPVLQSVSVAPEVKSEIPVKKTGVFSSPKRRPETESPPPQVEAVVEAPAEASPSPQNAVEASPPLALSTPLSPPAPVVERKSDPNAPVQVKVVPSREMHLPADHEASEISVVTEGNVKFPWRILMPTGAETKDAAK